MAETSILHHQPRLLRPQQLLELRHESRSQETLIEKGRASAQLGKEISKAGAA
jgi:hypothetical protein